MIATLNYFQAELRSDISTLCMHLRNKAYPQKSEALYNAMSSLVYYQILVDELDKLLSYRGRLIDDMSKFLAGEEYTKYAEEPKTIYEHALRYFEGDCALGTATPELAQWVANYADRNQMLRQKVYCFFPNLEINIVEEGELRPASESDLFKSNTTGFLRDIEASNALPEFNQFMSAIRVMIKQQVAVVDILTLLNAD